MNSGTALHVVVAGHTNAGKTSLLRTLTRRADFGEVSDRPGTTRHVERVDLRVDGQAAVQFFDTPGLEDAVTLLAHVQQLAAGSRPERIRRFLAGPEAQGVFEQEAKVLRALLEADAAFLVIDAREPVLPKYRDEVELLAACGKPVMPVLNFVAHASAREADWRAMLAAAGLHALVRFDAAAPFTGAERELYQDLGTLLPDRRAQLRAVIESLAREFLARRRAGCEIIATALVRTAALQRLADLEELDDPARRQPHVQALRQAVFERARQGADALLALYGFRQGDADEAPLPALEGRDSLDLFNPELLRQAGLRLGQGAVVGAAVGVAADLAVGGLSLGAGAALGGAIGGALSGGFTQLGRKLGHRLRGQQELRVEDAVLLLLARWLLGLLAALERRGHADTRRIASARGAGADGAHADGDATPSPPLAAAVRDLRPARSHPAWDGSGFGADTAARAEVVARVAQALQAQAEAQG